MAAQLAQSIASIPEDTHKTKRGGKRTKVSTKVKEAIIATAIQNPSLSPQDIAKIHDISRPFVHGLLSQFNITKADIDDFKRNEADLLTALRLRIYNTLTDEDLKSASALQRMTMYGIGYDKYRLETGQSTENQSVLVTAISDLKQRKRAKVEHKQDGAPIDIT
jgi:hypothetical protein